MYSLADQAGVLLTNSVVILRSFKALFAVANAAPEWQAGL